MNNNNAPLGKGLSALLTSTDPKVITQTKLKSAFIPDVDITLIEKNPFQPRVNTEDKIDELVESIKEQGLMSPLIVTEIDNGKYRLIAGERRLLASKKAGLKTVPVIVKEAAGEKLLEMAIIENIQRKDLNPIEEANAYKQLKIGFKLNISQISRKIGITAFVITQRLTLLDLPDFAQQALMRDEISMLHAEQLFPLIKDPESMKIALGLCIKNKLSAKQLRSIVDKLAAGLSLERVKKIRDDKTREMEIGLTKLIGRKIYFTRTVKGGKIIISFNNDKELDDIYKRFSYIGYHI